MASILLIEDDPLVVRMYKKVLAFEGFTVMDAPNGSEGLKLAREQKPNLIFLDVMMPKMNGIEVLEHLKSDPEVKDIPVIMLTNLSGTQDTENALKKGAFAYMVKSDYKPKEVAMKAKEMLSGQAQSAATPAQNVSQPQATQTPAVQPQTAAQAPVQPTAQTAQAQPAQQPQVQQNQGNTKSSNQ
jgi:CheY-like chemotaxis protein